MADSRSTPIDVVAERVESGRVPSKALKQAFARLYAVSGNASEVSSILGVPYGTTKDWLSDPRFIQMVHNERTLAMAGKGASIGFRALLEIVEERVVNPDGSLGPYVAPIAERRQAAMALVRFGGHSEAAAAQAAQAQAAVALHDLSEDQLQAHIAQAQATLAGLHRADPPRITTDQPANGLI